VHGIEHDLKADGSIVPDDASSLTETDEPAADAVTDASDEQPVDLGKKDAEPAADTEDVPADAGATKADDAEPKKTDGEADAK
jgi:preprotein translocase subunit YajC